MSNVLETLSDMRSVVQSDLNVGTNSSLFPPTRIDSAINRAYVNKAARLFRWTALEDSKKTSTVAGDDYYDFPENWSPDSIWGVWVDGVMYGEKPDGSPMAFADYLIWKANNPTSDLKKWARQYKRYFITPTPTADGSNNITIYGQLVAPKLVNDGDVTIFSYDMPECNEAIVLEATAILKRKGEISGEMYSDEAKQILVVAYNKIRQEKNKHEKNQPQWNVPDFFAKTSTKETTIGDFD